MVRMRALETGKPVMRGTNSGISALIDGFGNVIDQAPQFTEATLKNSLNLTEGETPFLRWGSTPILLLCALGLLLALIAGYRSDVLEQQP